jgi:hypothetical protein
MIPVELTESQIQRVERYAIEHHMNGLESQCLIAASKSATSADRAILTRIVDEDPDLRALFI